MTNSNTGLFIFWSNRILVQLIFPGLSFISKSPPLPSNTFLSAEAVLWLMEHVENISSEKKAVAIMEQMLSRNLIRHCSGDTTRKTFMYGFYLYYILDKENSSPYQGNMFAFRCDWIEVRLKVLLSLQD